MASLRITDEPAYVLHRHDWSESSLILELFTRNQGRVAVVAKGAKRPSSSLRPILLPLQRLLVAYGGDAEIRTLRSAEWAGGHVMPQGDALLSGYYLNELLLALLARDDPHCGLFDVYADAVAVLAGGSSPALQTALRTFELLLLREMGVLPALDIETATLQPLHPASFYCLVADGGLRRAAPGDRSGLEGVHWLALGEALLPGHGFIEVMQAIAPATSALKHQLRAILQHHCGGDALRTRRMMAELQAL